MMVTVYMFLYMRHEQLSSLFYDGGRLCSYTRDISSYRHYLMMVAVYVLIHET